MTFRSEFSMEEATAARTSWCRETERTGRVASGASPPPAPAIIASDSVVGGVWCPAGPHLRFYTPVCQEQEATKPPAVAASCSYHHNQKAKFISGQVTVLHFNLVFPRRLHIGPL